jgi:hypothetical protein
LITKPAPGDEKKPKLLIMDRTPLSVLSNLDGALDWLFVPGCDVWMTDMVLIESRRPSEPGADPRSRARATFEKWLAAKKHLIHVVSTEMGKKHTDLMTLWEMAGRPEHLRPSRPNGEASVLDKIKTSRHLFERNDAFLVLMDDRDGREALKVLRANADLMSTQTFLQWIAEDFKIKAAKTAWLTLERRRGEFDPDPADIPT